MSTLTRRNFLATSLATTSLLAAPALLRAQPASPARVRRNASTMAASDPFFSDYADAVTALHELDLGGLDGWRKQALLHLEFCPHGAADFLAWHRHYITMFEVICGELLGKPDFALAYWDWSSANGELPRPFFANGGLNVEFWRDEANASHPNWVGGRTVRTSPTRGITAGFGLQDDPLRGGSFTTRSINRIKRLDRFNLFQGRLEGSPHNNGHVVSGAGGGHIGNGMSPLDPAFWLHHCNIDRIWAEWQADGNGTPALDRTYQNQFVDARGMPIDGEFTANNARSTIDLGFTYDTTPAIPDGTNLELSSLTDLLEQPQFSALSAGFDAGPTRIGSSSAAQSALPLVPTSIPVAADEIVPALFSPRGFLTRSIDTEAATVGIEQGRILARLTGIEAKGQITDLVTNVFVNCPYLSPETPYDDEHYADTFSFFMPPSGEDHGGHDGKHSSDVLVDITEPLRQQAGDGRIDPENIEIQLMALPAAATTELGEATEFVVGKVEILRV